MGYSRPLRRIIAASAITVGAGGIVLACYGLYIQNQAQTLLEDLTKLSVGKSTAEDTDIFARRHKRFVTSHDCHGDGCTTSFEVYNTWLSAIKLEPTARFYADFTVTRGVLTERGASLLRSMPIYPTFAGSAGSVREYANLPSHMTGQAHYSFPTPVGKPYLRVVLDSQASAVQRQHAFNFSFRCLVKPGWGCDLPCDYLPMAWQDWRLELRDSGFPIYDFNEVYPNNARCRQ
jgi:hypothetical protein